MDSPSDTELAERHFEGDKHALEKLIDRYSGLIRYYCRKVFEDEDLAEDLTQATILAIIAKIRQFDPKRKDANFRKWATTIAFRTALNYRHRILQERAIKNELEKENINTAEEHNPIKALQDKETKDTVEAAVDTLPEPTRTSIHLFYFQGFSIDDICEALTLKKWQVKHQLSKGRKILYKALKDLI